MNKLQINRLLVSRHGVTDWNHIGKRQGRTETELSDVGIAQAQILGEAFLRCQVSTIYTSPQLRCKQTSDIASELSGSKVIILNDLQDLDLGSTTGLTFEELDRDYAQFLEARSHEKGSTRWPNGESYEDVLARVTRTIARISEAKSIMPAIVTHEMVAKTILVGIFGRASDPDWMKRLPHGHVFDLDLVAGKSRKVLANELN